MKTLLILAPCLPLLLTSCAGTRVSGTEFRSQANFDYAEWHGGTRPSLIMRGVNHSEPTRAGVTAIDATGKIVRDAGMMWIGGKVVPILR